MKVIGIAGGSGAGKSTVSYFLVDKYPNVFQVLNFDDYQMQDVDDSTPRYAGMVNWDHPDIIRWDDLVRDIESLKAGNNLEIMTWSHRSNPDYKNHGEMKHRLVEVKPVLIVEGYLALHDPKVLGLYDKTFYLDLDKEARDSRRDKGTIVGHDGYIDKVLTPMFKKFVEPTRDIADVVIEVRGMSVDQIASELMKGIEIS